MHRSAVADAKLREIVHRDFTDFSALADAFKAADACFFCLGDQSSAGMAEDAYRAITYDTTLAAARALPQAASFTFIYVSGEGTDSTERGRWMWARVKGRTENVGRSGAGGFGAGPYTSGRHSTSMRGGAPLCLTRIAETSQVGLPSGTVCSLNGRPGRTSWRQQHCSRVWRSA